GSDNLGPLACWLRPHARCGRLRWVVAHASGQPGGRANAASQHRRLAGHPGVRPASRPAIGGGRAMLRPFGCQAGVAVWPLPPAVTGGVVVAAGLYLWGVRRVARRHPARPWPAWRTWMFLGGLAVVVLATESGIGSYDDVLFWDHMVQHLMLIMV